MSPKVFAALSTPTTLGSMLLLASATLLAVDVGATYALDSDRFSRPGVPRLTSAHIASSKLSTAVAPASASIASDATLFTDRIAMRPAASVDRAHANGSHVVNAWRRPKRIAPWSAAVDRNRFVARRPLAGTSLASGRRLPIVLAEVTAAKEIVANRPKRSRAVSGPRVNVAHAGAHLALLRVRQAPVPARPRTAAKRGVVVARRTTVISPAPAAPTPSLRDVRRYVMGKLKSRDKSSSVISSNTFTKDGDVLVYLVVRDKNHEWFEKDIVERSGSHLHINATMLHTFAHAHRRARAIATDMASTT